MEHQTILPTSWGFGLFQDQESTLQNFLHKETVLRFWQIDDVIPASELKADFPCLLWLSPAGLRAMQKMPAAVQRHLELTPKVLLLDKQYTLRDFEEASDLGIAEVIRPPLSKKRLKAVLARALEVSSVHQDIMCMTREIMLERELLQRKNELLSFLVHFLTNTSDIFDVQEILQRAFESLSMLFSARSLHAAISIPADDDTGRSHIALHINAHNTAEAYPHWRNMLLTQAKKHFGTELVISDEQHLHLKKQHHKWREMVPADGTVLPFPIFVGAEKFGILLLMTEIERNLGRDQAVALDSAMKHLALSIKNASKFRMMQLQADFDVLTKVHSRRHFESRLDDEMDRFHRYEQSLSVIMLDIDNFKHVNDTYGHQVGDDVLQGVASIISQTVRTTDYCARYGGEEFAILLPHTEQQQAFSLAERLRKKIAKKEFLIDGHHIRITVSLGLSYLIQGMSKDKDTLIAEADSALYEAKRSGKNCTRETVRDVSKTA